MKTFFRLFQYSLKYRSAFFSGVFVSFIVAVLNGLSVTAFVPLFDAIGDEREFFEIQFSDSERKILNQAMLYSHKKVHERPEIPASGEKINKVLANRILVAIPFDQDTGLNRMEHFRLKTIIQWKLKINESGYSPFKVVLTACLVVLPLYLLRLLLQLLSVRLIARTGYRAVCDLRDELYRAVQRLPLTFFYREKTGNLMSRLVNDTETISAVISSNLRDAITNLFIIITHLLLLAYLNWVLLIVSVITVPVILSPVTLFGRKIRKSTTRSQELLGGMNAHLQETVQGIRVIRAHAMEKFESDRFFGINHWLYWRTFKQDFYIQAGPNLVELTSSLVVVGIIALGAFFMDPVNFTRGEFIAFLITLLFIIRPIIQLSGMYSKIQAANISGKRVFEIIDMPPETVDPVKPSPLHPLRKRITFDRVSFTYPGTEREVLHQISLTVPAGSTVAFVGESGGGKSTLMDLFARFFEPTKGKILIDGVDIQSCRIADHRQRIGIVTQEIFLFYGTIKENIAYGRHDLPDQEIEKAARLAHAHDFIMDLPDGYETIVGERGFTLSGGQRQRIAIARALLRDPEILILDEATSALDTQSEKLVQHALSRLFQNRTTFVIAHRLSTIESADLIVVMSQGKIVDTGTHHELMKKSGLYARLQELAGSSRN